MDNVLKFVKIPDETNYWFVRASRGARYYKDFMVNNFIAVASIVDLNFIKKINVVGLTKKDALTIFKKKFNKYVRDTIENYEPYKNATTDVAKEKEKSKRLARSTTLSKVNYSFVNEMKIGDIVIVPGKSAKSFLIGIVSSDCFDTDIKHEFIPNKKKKQSYDECYFTLKRGVFWLKEISFSEFPDKMNSITNTHQSVLNISNYAESINPLISSRYIYKENFFIRIGVKTKDNVSSDDLYYLQKITHEIIKENDITINQKTKVQSPGHIEFFALAQQHPVMALVVLLGSLFAEIKIPNLIEIKAIIPGITAWINKLKMNKLDSELQQQQIKQEKIKTKKEQEELKQEEIKTKKEQEKLEQEKVKTLKLKKSVVEKHKKEVLDNFSDDELEKVKSLDLTSDPVGNEIPVEKQMEKLSNYMDICEKSKQQDIKQKENDETRE